MIPLVNKSNILAPDSDYPYGDIKDKNLDKNGNPDGLPGTDMNRRDFADMFQFFEKLMDESGITPNNVPDNAYSGFQLWEALQEVCGLNAWNTHTITIGDFADLSVSAATGTLRYKIQGKTLFFFIDATITPNSDYIEMDCFFPSLFTLKSNKVYLPCFRVSDSKEFVCFTKDIGGGLPSFAIQSYPTPGTTIFSTSSQEFSFSGVLELA